MAHGPVRVPLAAPNRFLPGESEAIHDAIARVVSSGTWVLGPEVSSFEQDFAAVLGAADVVGVGNGTDALTLALRALDVGGTDEVLVVANDGGFGAVAASALGLRIVVADIDQALGGPTVDTLASACSPATRVVIVTHLHGTALPLADIDAWRRAHGLLLIEDCAQAHGLRVDGEHVGSVGDLATFSFYPTKNLGALGDAGAVTVPTGARPADLGGRLRRLREYGWGERYRVELGGGRNSRLDELQAAVLRARLPFLEERTARRRALGGTWQAALGDAARLAGTGRPSVAHHLVVETSSSAARDSLREALAAAGVADAVHYPWLVQEMPGLSATADTPAAARRRDCMVSLPAEPMLADGEIDHVVSVLRTWVRRQR